MDTTFIEDFKGFMEVRIADILKSCNSYFMRKNCREAYLRGFWDASGLMTGE